MIHVVGGTYVEHCREPHWNELFGSGLRAVTALAQVGASAEFHTAVGPEQRLVLNLKAEEAAVALHLTDAAETIAFEYLHPLSKPAIEPDVYVANCARTPIEICVEADNVIRFGIVEGSAKINARMAVYDPQTPSNPRPFTENGSTAERLAVVANKVEARRLTGESDAEVACLKLVASGAEIAVVKCGAAGCVVGTASGLEWVPAFFTESVWPIGSGDVFTALFARGWMESNLKPSEAALFASRGTAHYVEKRTFPIGTDLDIARVPVKVRDRGQHKQVYLAGPFFNLPQRWLIEEFLFALRGAGVRVFSPVHDVGPGPADLIYKADIDGLKSSGVVLACLDGLDPGTVYEVGYAQSIGLPVVCFTSAERSEDLKMFVGGKCQVVSDFATAFYRTVWAATCE